jgi:hypothetical protein
LNPKWTLQMGESVVDLEYTLGGLCNIPEHTRDGEPNSKAAIAS